jgi:metallo-beta-lactamase class B
LQAKSYSQFNVETGLTARLPGRARRPPVQGRPHDWVGPIALSAHVTGGATRGCTSWSFRVRDEDRVLNVVSACGLGVTAGMRIPNKAPTWSAASRTAALPADIWVTGHARLWGRYRKFVAGDAAKNPVDQNPVDPFIDPEATGVHRSR